PGRKLSSTKFGMSNSAGNQNVSSALLFSSLIRFQLRKNRIAKLAHQGGRFLCGGYERVEISIVPFCDRAVWLNEMRFPKIQKQPFVLSRNDFVTPMMCFHLAANVCSKNNKRVSMVAVSGNNLPRCVA